MSSIPKTIRYSLLGVAWRLAAGLAVLLCFLGLSSLNEWHSHYAPSKAWAAKIAEREDLDWAPVVKAAVEDMPPPEKPYTDKEIFYKQFLNRIRDSKVEISTTPKDPGVSQKIEAYRQDLKNKNELLSDLADEIKKSKEDRASQRQKFQRLNELAGQINKARKAKGEELAELIQERASIREDIRDLETNRSLVRARLQEELSDLTARIKSSEDGIREAFNAALPAAHPLNGAFVRFIGEKRALEIGDETNPFYIVYFLLWYGLKGLIALLACFVLVPWILSLSSLLGRNPDPKSVREGITGWIDDRFSELFRARTVSTVATVAAAMVISGATLAGVSRATGEPPPVPQFLQNGGEDSAGAKGEKGDPGRPGSPAPPVRDGIDGTNGIDGKDAGIPPELQKTLNDQTRQIQEQAALIDGLKDSIEKLSLALKTGVSPATKGDLATLATKEDLTQGVGPLNSGLSIVDQKVDTLTSTDQSMKSSLEEADRSLDRIHNTTSKAASDVQQVKTDVAKAEDVPAIAAYLLRINAMPDGVLTRLNPFARYEVTDEVIGTVKRATRYHDNDSEVQTVLNGLEQVKGKKMGAGQLRLVLLYYTPVKSDPGAYTLLDKKLMPLILKVSRL